MPLRYRTAYHREERQNIILRAPSISSRNLSRGILKIQFRFERMVKQEIMYGRQIRSVSMRQIIVRVRNISHSIKFNTW